MPDDAEIKEEMTKLDNANMQFEYIILSGPFPFTNYVSNVIVKPIDDNICEISWSSQFNTDAETEMKSVLEGFYNAIIEGLETMVNNNTAVG